MLSSIGLQPSNQTVRLVDSERLIAQRVRVKPDAKLIFKTTETAILQPNLLDLDFPNDFDITQNSNNDDLVDLGNSQMSTFFHEFSENQNTVCKKEEKKTSSNYKTINGLGFYYCESCPFLCLNVKLILEHNEKDLHFHQSPNKSLLRTKCIGCDNIFYSVNVLRCHLIEDHYVLSAEVDGLVQLIIEANKKDTLYNINNEESQTVNNNLVDFNDAILSTSEFGLVSHFNIDQNTENNSAENYQPNEARDDFWDSCQDQVFGELPSNNTNEDTNIKEKRIFRCTTGTCKARFSTENNLNYHTKCHLNDKFFNCIEFGCSFTNPKWLPMMTHLWKKHAIDIGMFSCDQCEFKTHSQYKLNTFHKNIHKSEKPFLCPECNKGFKSIKQLRNHKMIHTRNDSEKLECFQCSRAFATKHMLHQHIAGVHIGMRPYACGLCEYSTAVASSLKLHERIHTGEKPFACNECGYRTADHNTLRKHKMRHTGSKKYKCDVCGYTCIQVSAYKKHIEAKHSGMDLGLLYSCNMCNFKSITKEVYMQHIVKHKGEMHQKNRVCEPRDTLDEIYNKKEILQANVVEQPYRINTIRVKPINTMTPNEI